MEKSEILKSFRTRLKDIRMRRGLNQEQFAQLIDVSKGAVGNWESEDNESLPSNKNLIKIAERLGYSTEYILGKSQEEGQGASYPRHREERMVGMASPEVDQVARDLEQIKEADPEAFETVRRVVVIYHQNIKRKRGGRKKKTGGSHLPPVATDVTNLMPDPNLSERVRKAADALTLLALKQVKEQHKKRS